MMMTDPRKSRTPAFKMLYCSPEYDLVFRLPDPALKLWLFYYRKEGATREGWACNETISMTCGMSEKTITKWRKYLRKYGWLEQIGVHQIKGKGSTPLMRCHRGTIPTKAPDKRGMSAKSKERRFKPTQKAEMPSGKLSPVVEVTARENFPIATRENLPSQSAATRENFPSTTRETFPVKVDINPLVEKTPEVDGVKSPKTVTQADSQSGLGVESDVKFCKIISGTCKAPAQPNGYCTKHQNPMFR
jgi:hypothetical protein